MRVQQNLLRPDRDLKAILTYLMCEQSNSLYNCGVYWGRQIFFKTGKIVSKLDPVYELGKSKHARAMPSTPAQQTLLSVSVRAACTQYVSLCQFSSTESRI